MKWYSAIHTTTHCVVTIGAPHIAVIDIMYVCVQTVVFSADFTIFLYKLSARAHIAIVCGAVVAYSVRNVCRISDGHHLVDMAVNTG